MISADVEGLFWTKGSRSCQLGVRVKDGPTTNFIGFRNQAWTMPWTMTAYRDL